MADEEQEAPPGMRWVRLSEEAKARQRALGLPTEDRLVEIWTDTPEQLAEWQQMQEEIRQQRLREPFLYRAVQLDHRSGYTDVISERRVQGPMQAVV